MYVLMLLWNQVLPLRFGYIQMTSTQEHMYVSFEDIPVKKRTQTFTIYKKWHVYHFYSVKDIVHSYHNISVKNGYRNFCGTFVCSSTCATFNCFSIPKL